MNRGFIIAIDGPVASGKGTIAPKLASKLNGFYLYTGGIYRSVALYCLEQNISVTDEDQVVSALPHIHVVLDNSRVWLNDFDVTEKITAPEVAKAASPVATFSKVRDYFTKLQQEIAHKNCEEGRVVVAEGRDMGTVIFPDAAFKLFLTASPETRAERRLAQYQAKGETAMTFEAVLKDTNERDARDSNRTASPLPKNPKEFGYVILDNSDLSEQATLDAIIDELKAEKLYD